MLEIGKKLKFFLCLKQIKHLRYLLEMVILCNQDYSSEKYTTVFETYSFPLSTFQKHAIHAILENQHVLMTAHTGSGKTLPAEFAIEHWVAQKKKVIYTSPIKALSNQKFYEFSQKFPHIQFGLFTGDIKTNPEADVLIMTTEILMNRLFRSPTDSSMNPIQFQIDIETELAAVIFDEIHYINDADRGQVWEKTILLLPEHIQMIMLSATIDRPESFAHWIEQNHTQKQVHICPTNHRVVPLTHYGYLTMGEHEFKQIKDKPLQQKMRKMANEIHLLQDSSGRFNEEGYRHIRDTRLRFDRIPRKFVLNQLATNLKDQNMLPAIGFVFSRKQAEMCA